MDNTPRRLDTRKQYETPEGITLGLKIAGPLPRAIAWLIDGLVKLVVYIPLSFLYTFGGAGVGLLLLSMFFIEWFYPVFFELLSGSTPGKKVMGLAVIHDNGTPVQFSSSLMRNLLRAADFMPLMYGIGVMTSMFNKDFKRLGDIAAGTLVVYSEKEMTQQLSMEYDPKQPPPDLRVNEQRTLLDFAERNSSLSEDRKIELAEILYDITGRKGKEAVDELLGYASWLYKGKDE